jgi:hypothetical protein
VSHEFGVEPQFLDNMESPQHDKYVGTVKSAMFNFKSDYHLDSEVVKAYFEAVPGMIGKQIDTKEGIFAPALPFEQRHHDVDAAWVAKNCRSSNNREQVVQALMNVGVKVDSFGGCMHNKDFPIEFQNSLQDDAALQKVLSRYKFYLAFENSICRHYFTEKLFRSFAAGIIPILLGHPADAEYFLPHQVRIMTIMIYNFFWHYEQLSISIAVIIIVAKLISIQPYSSMIHDSHFFNAGCSHQGLGLSQHACSWRVCSPSLLG